MKKASKCRGSKDEMSSTTSFCLLPMIFQKPSFSCVVCLCVGLNGPIYIIYWVILEAFSCKFGSLVLIQYCNVFFSLVLDQIVQSNLLPLVKELLFKVNIIFIINIYVFEIRIENQISRS